MPTLKDLNLTESDIIRTKTTIGGKTIHFTAKPVFKGEYKEFQNDWGIVIDNNRIICGKDFYNAYLKNRLNLNLWVDVESMFIKQDINDFIDNLYRKELKIFKSRTKFFA